MPELPDVEVFRRALQPALHKAVEAVHVVDERASRVSPKTLRRHVLGHPLTEATRHGKWLFVDIGDDDRTLVVHFGMTGHFEHMTNGERPRYARIILDLEDDTHLAYVSRRMLGKLDLAKGRDAFVDEHGLGPDALDVAPARLRERLAAKSGTMKAALMDQSAVAGIGNVYADEILFQARIHPKAKVPDLDEAAWKRLGKHTHQVLQRAIEYGADPRRMPKTWLTPSRRKGAACPRCGTPLRREQVSGRTTYWCPKRV